MKNLVPYVVSRLQTNEESPLPLQRIVFSEDLVVACFVGEGMAAVSLWSPQLYWHDRVEWPLSNDSDEVVGLHFDSLDRKTLVAFSSGDFVEVRDGDASVVGSLETSVVSCEWSPAGDLAVVVCQSGKVVFLNTFDFDLGGEVVVGEHEMSAKDFELAESHVSVGWGKRETQFQGRGARAVSRDPTAQIKGEVRDVVSGVDRGECTVSWRGDGSVIAINSIVDNQRALRVFTVEGKLESVSEPATGLLGMCAYEPRGALIATVLASGHLQFFERNGLKRYSFELESPEKVRQLAWSSDSSVLSVCYTDRVDLWTQKNWHWYRKQTVPVAAVNGASVHWHPEMPRTMGLVSDEEVLFATWQFAVSSDQGLVAVIDTCEVKVTPLHVAGIPPPMAFASHKFEQQPLAVAVSAQETHNYVAVALESQVVLLDLDIDGAKLVVIDTFEVGGVQLLTFMDRQLLGYVSLSNELIDLRTLQPVGVQPSSPISVLKPEHYLCGNKVVQTISGMVVADFSEPCLDFVATGTECFGRTRSGKLLHSSNNIIAHGVTSILAGPDHLLYTTLTTLKFVHYNDPRNQHAAGVAASPNTDNKNNGATKHVSEQTREIERGSELVTIMSSQMAVVLQAPRGNIETIYPRMLVLGVVRASVAELDYMHAFQACKSHRIDMNLLFDLNPEQWKGHIDEFVSQLASDTNIDLFLSSLSDEDVTQTKYIDTSSTSGSETKPAQVVGKANNVVDLIIPHVSPACQITALAMKQPPALVEALERAQSSPELVKHLVFLSDAEMLYRTALSVYKPRLALVVAQQAQMDPKEYLPFLKARDTESEHRSKYNIDLFLRRVDRAIVHLIADPKSTQTEIVDFVLKHGLHASSIQLLRKAANSNAGSGSGQDERKQALHDIMLSQADIFIASSQYIDAGLNFELLGDNDRACDAYVQGCSWKRALALPSMTPERQLIIAERLVETCEANKLYADCGFLLQHFLHDSQRALEYYCRADKFDDALLVAALDPSLRSHLQSQLRESFGTFQELLVDCQAQVPAQLKRLRAIRSKRQEDMLGFDKIANQLENTGLDVADTLSLAGTEASGTTNASAYTRYTDKSSVGTAATDATRRTLKNQRRQDRKRARGKKGSVYEEDYLLSSTTRLVERLKSTRPELQELISALRRCDLAFYAEQLFAAYEKVLELLNESLDEIFAVDEESLVRFNDSGHEYIADRPQMPQVPDAL